MYSKTKIDKLVDKLLSFSTSNEEANENVVSRSTTATTSTKLDEGNWDSTIKEVMGSTPSEVATPKVGQEGSKAEGSVPKQGGVEKENEWDQDMSWQKEVDWPKEKKDEAEEVN